MDILTGVLTNRTVWANLIGALASWLFAKYAIAVTPDQQAAIVGGILVIVNIITEHATVGLVKK